MFEVSDKAGEMIKQFLEGKDGPHSVRLMMTGGGCCGGTLGMALDEPNENDQVFNEKGVTFIIDKELFEEVKPVSVDFVKSAMGEGFMIQSELSRKTAGSCGGPGSCCS